MQQYHKVSQGSISSSKTGETVKKMHCSPCWRARLENIGSLLLLLYNYIREAEERQQGGGASPTSSSALSPLSSGVLERQALGLASVASGSRPQGNSCCSVVLPPSMPRCAASAAGRDPLSSGRDVSVCREALKPVEQFVIIVETVSDLDYLLHCVTAAPDNTAPLGYFSHNLLLT